jgi:hypothetical protein
MGAETREPMVGLTPQGVSSGDVIVYGVHAGNHNALPAEALGPTIEKIISVTSRGALQIRHGRNRQGRNHEISL